MSFIARAPGKVDVPDVRHGWAAGWLAAHGTVPQIISKHMTPCSPHTRIHAPARGQEDGEYFVISVPAQSWALLPGSRPPKGTAGAAPLTGRWWTC